MIVNNIDTIREIKLWRRKDRRHLNQCKKQVVHRFSLRYLKPPIQDDALTVRDMAEFFSDVRHGTAGRFPYHFIITPNGVTYQCLPLTVIGLAAGKLNKEGIQIAVIGDFRKEAVTPAQALALRRLCGSLLVAGVSEIVGHTSVEGASKDLNKVCPGQHLYLANLAAMAKQDLDKEHAQALLERGIEV